MSDVEHLFIVFICEGQKFRPKCCLEPAWFVGRIQAQLDPGPPLAAASVWFWSCPGRSARLIFASQRPQLKIQDRPSSQPGPACAWRWARGSCHVRGLSWDQGPGG